MNDIRLSVNNIQIDAMQNEIFPVLLGPEASYRNIERIYKEHEAYVAAFALLLHLFCFCSHSPRFFPRLTSLAGPLRAPTR